MKQKRTVSVSDAVEQQRINCDDTHCTAMRGIECRRLKRLHKFGRGNLVNSGYELLVSDLIPSFLPPFHSVVGGVEKHLVLHEMKNKNC